MTGIVLQARMGSKRLPGKSILPLGGSTIVGEAIARLSLVPADLRILATDAASSALLEKVARDAGWELAVGPEDDVLERFCGVIRHYDLDLVVRATGDNPLVSWELATDLLELRSELESSGCAPDYIGQIGMPKGMGVELISASALLRAGREARKPGEREHVCPYLYDNPDSFLILRPPAPHRYAAYGDINLSVDTNEDYAFLSSMYSALYEGRPIRDTSILAWLGEQVCKA